ncbi:hypothetical protein A5717_15950 [Mycolicibacterium porcinum]|uniref:hypothetical protein n=1 Tax=Mycolicibacterium porcinum TaxID=39693 RepID=UPI00080B3DD5|nr:hypothetical protein [Mycolicibacterium porcinum]OCB12735.1 hypothetical protein A5717_15950 [Mycolicibacterium porcinum]
MSVLYVAKRGSFDEFMKEYDPSVAATYRAAGQTLLFPSVANRDIEARVAITMRLLEDGADPSVVCDGINVLHVLLGPNKKHDAPVEAPMLRRLIEKGADINQPSTKWGPPLLGLIHNGPRPETAAAPFYDVFFDQPNLDIDVKYGNSVLRNDIFGDLWNLPLLRERVMAYEQAHHAPR